jgi:hypothetical protein
MPPMTMGEVLENEGISQDILDFYREKTKDGSISLMVVKQGYVGNSKQLNRGMVLK